MNTTREEEVNKKTHNIVAGKVGIGIKLRHVSEKNRQPQRGALKEPVKRSGISPFSKLACAILE